MPEHQYLKKYIVVVKHGLMLQREELTGTFFSPQVHLNCGISPRVQDFPGDDTYNGHPTEENR